MSYVALTVIALPATPVIEATPEADVMVRRAQARDTTAFEQLYRLHVPRIYAVCLRITGNPSHADEMTQQAFLKAWDKLPCFRGESSFGSWLHRIAINTALAFLRAEQRRLRRVFGTEDPSLFENETSCVAPANGARLDLEAAIAQLPPQTRVVFVLHDIEGWKHEEIAAELGVVVGTSKAQLHRARKLLQEALK